MSPIADASSHLPLLIAALLCFIAWVPPFKVHAKAGRFEIFAIDFAVGAFLLSSIAAVALGNVGTDLPFSDRLLVSSKTAQALAVGAGVSFGFGNTLLLGGASLLGVSGAFAITGGIGIGIASFLLPAANRNNGTLIAASIGLLAAVIGIAACRLLSPKVVTPKGQPQGPIRLSRATKGIIVAVLGGLGVGIAYPFAIRAAFDDFGLGPYACAFLFCSGVLGINLILSLYFFNIALDGPALPLRTYFAGWPKQHFAGLISGLIWGTGGLAFLLGRSAPTSPRTGSDALPLLSVPLVGILGLYLWRELVKAPALARVLLLLALIVVTVSIGLLMLTGTSSTSATQ